MQAKHPTQDDNGDATCDVLAFTPSALLACCAYARCLSAGNLAALDSREAWCISLRSLTHALEPDAPCSSMV